MAVPLSPLPASTEEFLASNAGNAGDLPPEPVPDRRFAGFGVY
jgi:hypothetical protein